MSRLEQQGAALWIENLDKVYADGTRALRGLSLHIPAGSFFGLLGPNGSGKSTRRRTCTSIAFRSAREVLTYHGRYFGMAQPDAGRRADELLEVFDLTAKATAKPNRLSGGMRRRLLIARALMHRPRLLILDEPTAGVDLGLRRELWSYLSHLHRHEDTTILLTTHYLEEAEELCDRVAFIRHGELISEGTVSDLVDQYGGGDLEDAYVEAMR